MAFDILAHSNIGDIIQKQLSLKQISTAPSLTLINVIHCSLLVTSHSITSQYLRGRGGRERG